MKASPKSKYLHLAYYCGYSGKELLPKFVRKRNTVLLQDRKNSTYSLNADIMLTQLPADIKFLISMEKLLTTYGYLPHHMDSLQIPVMGAYLAKSSSFSAFQESYLLPF